MKPRSKNFRILSSLRLPMSAGLAVSTMATTAFAAPTTINYATPAVYGETAVGSTATLPAITVTDGTKYAVGDVIRFSGTNATTNPFNTTATSYYVASVVGNTITVATTPGGTAVNAANSTTASTTFHGQDWFTAANWTGGTAPNANSVIANFGSSLNSSVPAVVLNGNVTLYGLSCGGGGSGDVGLVSGANGTGLYSLTFATDDATTPVISQGTGAVRLINFGSTGTGSGSLKLMLAGTQGLIINGVAAGALTGSGLDATSTASAKNTRFSNVDYTNFTGSAGIIVQRGELGLQAGSQLGSGVTAQNLTVGNAQTLTNNLLAGFQFSAGGQAVGNLNGNALGRIWASNDTLTIGTNNATGGDYAGSVGKDFVGNLTDTDLTKTGTGTQTISGVITGSGTVNANGASGTLILSGDNTFTGGATLTAGTLALAHANAISTNNLTVSGNGTFDNTSGAPVSLTGGLLMTGGSPTFTGTHAITFNGASTVGNGVTRTITVGGGTITLAGVLSEPVNANSSSLAKSGAGTLVLTNSNTYTGLTTINTGGILKIGSPTSLGGSTVNTSVTTTDTSTSATVLAVSNLLVGQLVTGTNIPANTTLTAIDVPTLTITLSQAAIGSGTDSATFEGMTDINSGGTLDLNGQTISESLNAGLDGSGAGGIGALINSNTGTPAEVASEIRNVGLFTVGGPGDLTLNQVHHTSSVGRNITKVGTGTLTLSGSTDNTRYGLIVDGGTVNLDKSGSARAVINNPLEINAGLVRLTGSGSDQINNTDVLQVDGGTFDMNGRNETVVALQAAAAGGVITNNGGGPSTLTFGGTASVGAYAGAIQNGTGVINLVKSGSGTQTLSGTNNYTGNTTVTGGTLSISSSYLANTSTVDIASGAIMNLNFAGNDNIATLVLGSTTVPSGTYNSSTPVYGVFFSGAGSLVVGAVVTPYQTWAQTNITGINPTADATQGGDPDKDGRNNLGEFAFNGNPLNGSDNGKIYMLTADSDYVGDPSAAKELILTVAVRTGTAAFTGTPSPAANQVADGITYSIEGSINLGSFLTVVNVVPTPVTTGLPAAGTGYEYRSFSLNGSDGLTGKGFLRAKVTAP